MLTKSDFLKFDQCRRRLWLHKKRPDLAMAVDAGRQKVFDDSQLVEKQACRLYPGIVDASDDNFEEAFRKTEEALKSGAPAIYQPTFRAGALFCRADILKRVPTAGGQVAWEIHEIKSSTEIKDYHLLDVAFQRLTLGRVRPQLKLGATKLLLVNNEYVRHGDIDPVQLLKIEDVTAEVNRLMRSVEASLEPAFGVLRSRVEPEVLILKQCSRPFDCEFIDHCWRDIPEHSVYRLNLDDADLERCVRRGQIRLEDVPADLVPGKKAAYYRAQMTGQPQIRPEELRAFLDGLEYPLHYLDFETFASPLPPFEGYRPYQNIPFQYPLHIQDEPGGPLRHEQFLADAYADPAPAVAAHLAERLAERGSVIAWNASFERSCNELLAARSPAHAERLLSANGRLVDPMLLVRGGAYVDGRFGGSASLKNVQPVLAPDLSYAELDVREGGTAQASWPILCDQSRPAAERARLYDQMLKYCGLDTLAMQRVVEEFREKCKV
ncbi:hypothetical protein A3C96_02300 [Candidatus Uhrbacteria bacterium RIFCSPHIGHO2_02_FULL_60_10]|uniref:DUF2779 domain-containing protein n=1 Tax=Candidatus Uhrbacteria bacterium RIFCSPHIGHO2_02_FULL_60_10 TaxID=1802392 RepID=A0A1F7U5L4_9BACT|nr:MAG: hypothetical protein A3C96_02300 [Candidatus Uhrbacteria bacterium RIFCSPHIGHO2_02_FULL_60_10]